MIDIIIPTLEYEQDGVKVIDKCIKYIKDNTSVDYKIHKVTDRIGWIKASNKGMKATKNDIILMNDDVFVGEKWLTKILKYQKEHDADIIGCKLMYPNSNIIQHAGGHIRFDGCGFHIGAGAIDMGQFDRVYDVPYVTFALVYIKREVIDKIGYLDEIYNRGYYDDCDYCFRARRKGFKILYVPVPAYHMESFTMKQNPAHNEDCTRNKNTFVERWLRRDENASNKPAMDNETTV
jgi:GT2 family glycosyltransferase